MESLLTILAQNLIGREGDYEIYTDRYVHELNEEVPKLERAKQRVQHSIDYARWYGKLIEADVKQWMEDAETAAGQARHTLADYGAANKTCFWGWLPNLKVRYRFGSDARRTVQVIRALIRQGRFDRVYYENYPLGHFGGGTDLNSLAGHGGDTIPDSFSSKAPGDWENRETDDAGGGIRGLRPLVLSPRPFVDDVSSTGDLFYSFGTPKGPGGDKDSPLRSSDKRDWSDGDDEKVNKESTSQTKDHPGSCLSTSAEDEESEDKYVVGNTLLANILEPVHNVFRNGSPRRRITSWQKGQRLGSGSFGTVYEGFPDDGFFFAIKEVPFLDQGSRGEHLLQLRQEISLLSRFEHKNIVQYLGTYESCYGRIEPRPVEH